MTKLTTNFTKEEFACSHCKIFYAVPELPTALQELRNLAGRPVHLLSAYRCALHNKKIGGAKNSLHVAGKAADIQIDGATVLETFELCKQIEAFRLGGIGIYPQEHFVHVDVRDKAARWARVDGNYVGLSVGLSYIKENPNA